MKIAIIGWGSLIRDPGDLPLETGKWNVDGPRLRVEFARISNDGCLTLVICPNAGVLQTLWAVSASHDLEPARQQLRIRESKPPLSAIHAINRKGKALGSCIDDESAGAIHAWLLGKSDLDAVVWTGLCSNWWEKRGCSYSPEDALRYLLDLKDPAQAVEYIRKAPEQIKTAFRELAADFLEKMRSTNNV